MNKALRWTCLLTLLAACLAAPVAAGEHRLGGGVHYWQSLDQLDDDFPEFEIQDDGISAVISYQYLPRFTSSPDAASTVASGWA